MFPFPDLVILDLKMPITDGFEVLKRIRKTMGLQILPVIIFTNSDSKHDAIRAYSSHASAFHQKPCAHDALVSLLKAGSFICSRRRWNTNVNRPKVGLYLTEASTAGSMKWKL